MNTSVLQNTNRVSNSIYKRPVPKKVSSKRRPPIVKWVNDKNLLERQNELRIFIDTRNLKTNVRFIAGVVYFLKNELNIKYVDENYITTCYKLCSREIGNVDAAIHNCMSRNQYIYRADDGSYDVTVFGDNLITIQSLL